MAEGNKTVVAIGKFDGIHKGHKKLLETASKLAKEAGFVSVGFIIENTGQNSLLMPYDRKKLINKLEYFCSKSHGLDIKGLSKATLEKLIDII